MSRPPFSVTCNVLYNLENADLSKFSRFMRWNIGFSVRFWGNWVGGHIHCLDDRLVFMMNALNRKHQHDTADIVIPYIEIRSVRLGRIKGLAKTVEAETEQGLLRVRCWSKGNDELAAEIAQRMG